MGLASPETKLSQQKAAEYLAQKLKYNERETKRLVRLYKKTGINYRYTILNLQDTYLNIPDASTAERMKLYEHNAMSLAEKAIRNTVKPELLQNITHIITVSCTGMYAPGLDIELVLKLNLPKDVERNCINFMGCYGAFNALKQANYICRQNPEAYVLIVCIELCSLHLQKIQSMDHFIANAIFGDGAACVLVHGKPQKGQNFLLQEFHCALAPSKQPAMAWYVRNHGFDIILSSYVPDILSNHIKEPVEKLLKSLQLNPEDIHYYAIHPGGKEILSAIEKVLAIEKEKNQPAHEVLQDYGNMSSPTILYVLKKWFDQLQSPTEKNILAMAFGPGLTIESALLKTHWHA